MSKLPISRTVYIALGSNLGDREQNIFSAVERLERHPDIWVMQGARIIETAPLGPEGQGPYLNTVVEVQTVLSLPKLLLACRKIEDGLGRIRFERWGPRTIDLDIIIAIDDICESEELTVPHAQMHKRRFVLAPLAELASDLIHPKFGKTVAELLEELPADAV